MPSRRLPLSSAVLWLASYLLAVWPGPASGEEDWIQHLLVVANKGVPESVELAHYYMERRGIATNRVLLLDCPQKLEITRQEYNETLRKPIERHLQSRGWLERDIAGTTVRNDCWLLVLCWGMPLKIAPDPGLKEPAAERLPPLFRRNEAAVDSELAALPAHDPPASGPLNNQFFRMQLFPASSRRVMLVARLDGPNAAVARALVDRALAVETTGLLGRGYFDCRGTKEPGYLPADERLRAACQAARRAGIECVLDENEPVFPTAFPMTEVGLYAGWYSAELTGAIARPGFRFRPGAITYHIHSYSATSMTTGWVGPCLARGAAAGIGNSYEPYLGLVLDPQIFFERLLAGKSFVESAYAATPAISWQQTVVGDPLYRPFPFAADEQTERLEASQHPQRAWAFLRKANLLVNNGR
ncbi:MAG: TIGR03790 family protein, partial [Verrucomicrobiae bacterium]|nr:TIGR03790 family protein [Verrucomicrobiae bacterium]